ncbi:MAG TPA: hypothetical protein VK433_05530 [Stellaceae bacterium]|nr:hypothetical protein [Stellaceae bacterium]
MAPAVPPSPSNTTAMVAETQDLLRIATPFRGLHDGTIWLTEGPLDPNTA